MLLTLLVKDLDMCVKEDIQVLLTAPLAGVNKTSELPCIWHYPVRKVINLLTKHNGNFNSAVV